MKKMFAFFAVLLLAVGFVAADPAEGYWKSVDEETNKVTGYWHIYVSGGELVGELVKVPGQSDLTIASAVESSYPGHPMSGKDLSRQTVINTPWIWGLSRRGNGDWRGGNIVDPGDGKKYGCTVQFFSAGSKVKTGAFSSMTVDVDTLQVRGSIGPFGRSQYWQRASEDQIPN